MDRDQLRNMAKKCDILIDPFRPGVLSRLELGYEDLKENPRLIYVQLTGWGQAGELADSAGTTSTTLHRADPFPCLHGMTSIGRFLP